MHTTIRRHHNPSPCPVTEVGAISITELGGPEGGWGPTWEGPHPELPEKPRYQGCSVARVRCRLSTVGVAVRDAGVAAWGRP
eukprot:155607-Prymnesium_polylepis.1